MIGAPIFDTIRGHFEPTSHVCMRFLDSMLCIMLAAIIHKSDAAVRKTAKTCLNWTTDKSDKAIINMIINHPRPLAKVHYVINEMPAYLLSMPASDSRQLPVQIVDAAFLQAPSPMVSARSPLSLGISR